MPATLKLRIVLNLVMGPPRSLNSLKDDHERELFPRTVAQERGWLLAPSPPLGLVLRARVQLDLLDAERSDLFRLVKSHAWTIASASSRRVTSSTASSVRSITTAQKSIAAG
jgi:hypothetical protein